MHAVTVLSYRRARIVEDAIESRRVGSEGKVHVWYTYYVASHSKADV